MDSLPLGPDLVSNELKSGGTLEGHYSPRVHILSFHCFFFSSARALLLAGPGWASRPATSHCLVGAPLPFPPPGLVRGGGSSHAAHQSKLLEPLCLLKSRPTRPSPNRAPCPPGRVTQSRAAWASGAPPLPRSAAAPRAAALGLSILRAARHSVGLGLPRPECRRRGCCSRGCSAEAASEAGATGRPERRLSSAGARGAGPRTEEEAAPRLPGPGARPEGAAAGRSRPGVSSSRLPESPPPPRAPGRPLGVSSAAPDSPARAARPPGAGACAPRGHHPRLPAGRARGRPPPSASPVRPPLPVARRELPGDRGAGCCPPAQPLSRRPPPLPLPPGPCPAVYMPVKPPAIPSPSLPRLPDGEASRPVNWTGRSDLGPPDSDPRPLGRLRHHLGGIRL